MKLLNKNGFGVPLIVSFNNGIVSKLVAGKSLDDENLIDKMADKSFARFTKVVIIPSSLFITNDENLLSYEKKLVGKKFTRSLERKFTNHPEKF